MTIQKTRWIPDTCSCVVEYTWDDTVDPTVRVHTLSAVVSTGKEHSGLDDATLYATILLENKTKNQIQQLAAQVNSFITVDVWLKQVKWLFSGHGTTRTLTVNFRSQLTNAHKTSLQAACDAAFGAGKVIIQ